MIDRVVLQVLDELREVRELERRRPTGCEQRRDALDEVVDVRDLRQDVVAENEVGLPALLCELASQVRAEELRHRFHPERDGRVRDIQRRLDAEHRDALRQEVLQEVAVVRGDLDHEAVRPEREALGHRVDVAPRVLDPRVGVGREVRVLREDVLRRDELGDLHEPAPLARADVQGVEGLGLLELLVRQDGLTERRLPEVDDREREWRPAMTTCGRSGHRRCPRVCQCLWVDRHSLHSVCGSATVEGLTLSESRDPSFEGSGNPQSARPSRTQALWPPRPIAFDSATSTSTRRASLGT